MEVVRTFREAYEPLLNRLQRCAHEEVNERTGSRISVLEHPTSFCLDMAGRRLPMCGVRRLYPATAAAEVAWFLQGTKRVGFIRGYAPIWDKFVEDDGDTVEAAYGHRWRNHFGRDQVDLAVRTLADNPTDRRVWISAWDPAADGLGATGQRNVPCPVGFSLSIVEGRLNSALFIRSSDVFVGLPYDVMGHALVMDAVATSIVARWTGALQLGFMHVTLAHPHLYEAHYGQARDALAGGPSDDAITMPGWGIYNIVSSPDSYVATVKAAAADRRQPTYSCKPEVIQ